ncbi:hypothetical protein SCHPADRAFT_948032 [Schizopora paradoxa]|uniref:Uncharacterized protein n=1 Tax=Schizopora paradoxa TaxID=27342 RepID=A0A0H2QWW5_9AGAM|nr:hypothetical protein SCHPADRAFT_948032 [Schizopora paradoxa]
MSCAVVVVAAPVLSMSSMRHVSRSLSTSSVVLTPDVQRRRSRRRPRWDCVLGSVRRVRTTAFEEHVASRTCRRGAAEGDTGDERFAVEGRGEVRCTGCTCRRLRVEEVFVVVDDNDNDANDASRSLTPSMENVVPTPDAFLLLLQVAAVVVARAGDGGLGSCFERGVLGGRAHDGACRVRQPSSSRSVGLVVALQKMREGGAMRVEATAVGVRVDGHGVRAVSLVGRREGVGVIVDDGEGVAYFHRAAALVEGARPTFLAGIDELRVVVRYAPTNDDQDTSSSCCSSWGEVLDGWTMVGQGVVCGGREREKFCWQK